MTISVTKEVMGTGNVEMTFSPELKKHRTSQIQDERSQLSGNSDPFERAQESFEESPRLNLKQ